MDTKTQFTFRNYWLFYAPPRSTFKYSDFCLHSAHLCVSYGYQTKVIISLYNKLTGFHNPPDTVHYAVRAEYLNIIQVTVALQQTVGRRPVTAEATVRSQPSPREIYGGKRGDGRGFPQSSSVFPCQYKSTSATYSFLCALLLPEVKTGETSKKQCSFGN